MQLFNSVQLLSNNCDQFISLVMLIVIETTEKTFTFFVCFNQYFILYLTTNSNWFSFIFSRFYKQMDLNFSLFLRIFLQVEFMTNSSAIFHTSLVLSEELEDVLSTSFNIAFFFYKIEWLLELPGRDRKGSSTSVITDPKVPWSTVGGGVSDNRKHYPKVVAVNALRCMSSRQLNAEIEIDSKLNVFSSLDGKRK